MKPIVGTKPSPSLPGKPDGKPDWFYPLIVGIASLILFGISIFCIYQLYKNSNVEKQINENGFKSQHNKIRNLQHNYDELKKLAELLSKQLSDQRAEISALKSQNQQQQNPVENYSSPSPLFAPPAPKFPVSVDNFLAKNSNDLAFGKIDPLFGTLLENREEGTFYLVRDGAANEDERVAVPRQKQFVTKDDYVYHYSNFYACNNPGGGEVWIRKPAVVRRTSDGWKLARMGELEIR